MRNWRLKQKEKSDEIERQLQQQAKKVNQPQQPTRKRELTIFSDSWGREVETNLELQYPRQEESYGVNIWGSSDSSEKPKPQSNQDKLKDIFGDRAETQKLKAENHLSE